MNDEKETNNAFARSRSNDGLAADSQDLICPFCHDTEFDALGLKLHLQSGSCDDFNDIVIPARYGG